MAELDKDVARLIGTYQSAAFDKDVDAFMRLYDPSVRVFDAWGVWAYEGAPAWRRAVEGWFTGLGTERTKVSFDDVQAWVGKDMVMKRFSPRARGRAGRIEKPFANITIVVREVAADEAKAA